MVVFMKSTEDIPSDQQYFLNAVAPSGRSIEPCVFLVAQGIANQAVSYTEKLLGDSCVAVNLLEEAAATVSEVIRAKEAAQIAPILDVRRYLFRVFLRKVAEARRNETTYQEASQWYSHPRDDTHGDGLDSQGWEPICRLHINWPKKVLFIEVAARVEVSPQRGCKGTACLSG